MWLYEVRTSKRQLNKKMREIVLTRRESRVRVTSRRTMVVIDGIRCGVFLDTACMMDPHTLQNMLCIRNARVGSRSTISRISSRWFVDQS